jgi:hypothetical protein
MAQIPLTWGGTDADGQPLRWDTPGLRWDGFVPQPKPKHMPQLRVLLGFANAPDHSLDELASAVSQKLYGNALYDAPPTLVPPVTKAALDAAQSNFSDAVAAAAMGGPEDTADKNNKREIVIELLRKLAAWVQPRHLNDLANLLSSGFDAASTNRASAALDAPAITNIRNGNSGQLVLKVVPISNAKCYEVRCFHLSPEGTPGVPQSAGLFTDSRNMKVGSLTPGQNYQFQVRAIGGSTGVSDWSNPVSHMSL